MLLFHRLSFFGFAFMVIGVLQIELEIPEAQSLKDKRRVIKSLKVRSRAWAVGRASGGGRGDSGCQKSHKRPGRFQDTHCLAP